MIPWSYTDGSIYIVTITLDYISSAKWNLMLLHTMSSSRNSLNDGHSKPHILIVFYYELLTVHSINIMYMLKSNKSLYISLIFY